MKYAIEMYFDKETEAKIMSLPQKVADAGLSTKFLEWKTRPHITMAVFNDIDESKCIDLLKEFVKDVKAIPAFLDSVAMFNDTKLIHNYRCNIVSEKLMVLHFILQNILTSIYAYVINT